MSISEPAPAPNTWSVQRVLRLEQPGERAAFWAALATLTVSYLPRVFGEPSWTRDDYNLLNWGDSLAQPAGHFLPQGRFGLVLLWQVLNFIGLPPQQAVPLTAIISIGLLALCAVLLVRIWDLQKAPLAAGLVGALCFTHPFVAEIFSFRTAPIFYAACVTLGIAGVLLAKEGRTVLGTLLIGVALSIYQVALDVTLVALVIGALLAVANPDLRPVEALRRFLRPSIAFVAGTVGYLLVNKQVMAAFHADPSLRQAFLQPAELRHRLTVVGQIYAWMFVEERQLGTALQVDLLLVLLVAAVIGLVVRTVREPARLALGLLLLIAAALSVVGVLAVLQDWWPAPRTLTALGVFWCGVVALALRTWPQRAALPIGAAGALIALSYCGTQARIQSDQQRVNRYDHAIAARVLERLEEQPGGAKMATVVMVHYQLYYPFLTSTWMDIQASAAGTAWSQTWLLVEATGRRLRQPTAEERRAAEAACTSAPHWPEPKAVFIMGETGVTCF